MWLSHAAARQSRVSLTTCWAGCAFAADAARVQVITKLKGDLKTVAERNARLLRKMTEMQLLLTNASRQGLVTPKVRTGRQL